MALVPAFMHVLGRWNWSAPGPLVRLREPDRVGEIGDDLNSDCREKVGPRSIRRTGYVCACNP